MYKTLIYNLINLRPCECAEDLQIFFTPGEGILNTVDPIDYYNQDLVYKLNIGSTYVLGPHDVITTVRHKAYIQTCYNIYKVCRKIPTPPYITYMGQEPQIAELIEVEVSRSSNRLDYYNFLYGE